MQSTKAKGWIWPTERAALGERCLVGKTSFPLHNLPFSPPATQRILPASLPVNVVSVLHSRKLRLVQLRKSLLSRNRQQDWAEALKGPSAAFLPCSSLYMTSVHWPGLHESLSLSSNRNLKSSLSGPAHKYLQPAPQACLASLWPFPTGPDWKNCKAQLRAQREPSARSTASGVYTPASSLQGACACPVIPATRAESTDPTHWPWHHASSTYRALSVLLRTYTPEYSGSQSPRTLSGCLSVKLKLFHSTFVKY